MKILLYTPQPTDATSLYRAYGVWPFIPGVEIVPYRGESVTWPDVIDIDLAYFHRPFLPGMFQIVDYLKRMKIPVWVDFDDNMVEIPKYLNIRGTYDAKIIRQFIEMADIVTVTTEELAKVYGRGDVVPNALNPQILSPRKPATKKRILWRGSHSHAADLYHFREPIKQLMADFPDWTFVWFGMHPVWTDEGIFIQGTDPFYYFDKLQEISAKIAIVPLIDDSFNRCKSNIAELELSWMGATVITPDWPGWTSKHRYNNRLSFYEEVKRAIEQEPEPSELVYLQDVNEIRKNILDKWVGKL